MKDSILKQILKNMYHKLIKMKTLEQREFAIYDIKRVLKKQEVSHGKKICVGFMKQLDSVWEKGLPVYNQMMSDDRFTVYLLEVENKDVSVQETLNNNRESRLLKNGKFIGKLDEISFKNLYLDYLFYGRPYDRYLPKWLQSKYVRKQTLICYIPYYYRIGQDQSYLNERFINNIYYYFVESKHIEKFEIKKQEYTINKYNKKVECHGYPIFDQLWGLSNDTLKRNKKPCVLWAPRWTTDKNIGGSNFFKYKNYFLSNDFLDQYSLIIRPHPLMFGNFISTKEMTTEEVELFKKECKNRGIYIDSNPSFVESVKLSDVLISDVSSMIVEYMVTCKPVIICKTDARIWGRIDPGLLTCMYKAGNCKEIETELFSAINNDILSNKRRDYISNELQISSVKSSQRISQRIVDDFLSRIV